jgi:hypothetical protein
MSEFAKSDDQDKSRSPRDKSFDPPYGAKQ